MSENGHEFQCVQSLTSENCRAIGRLQSPKDEFLKMGSFLLLPSRGSRWEGGKGSKSSEEWVCLPRKEHTVRLRAYLWAISSLPSCLCSQGAEPMALLQASTGDLVSNWNSPVFYRIIGKICPLSTRVMSHTEVKLYLPGPILGIIWARPAWGQRQLKEPRANRERSWRHCLSSWSRPCLESPRFNLHEPVESPLCIKPCLCRRSRHRHVSSRQKMSW